MKSKKLKKKVKKSQNMHQIASLFKCFSLLIFNVLFCQFVILQKNIDKAFLKEKAK